MSRYIRSQVVENILFSKLVLICLTTVFIGFQVYQFKYLNLDKIIDRKITSIVKVLDTMEPEDLYFFYLVEKKTELEDSKKIKNKFSKLYTVQNIDFGIHKKLKIKREFYWFHHISMQIASLLMILFLGYVDILLWKYSRVCTIR